MYDFDYTEIQNDAEESVKPNPRKVRWQIIVAIAGTAVLMVGLIWFMFAGIKIIFPDYIAGNNMIKAGGKYIYIQDGIIRYKGGITDDSKDIIAADADSSLLSNGKTVYYVENGNICSVELDGKDAKVLRESVGQAELVHRYHDLLYYIAQEKNAAGSLSLYQIDLKTGEETVIDSVKPATWDFCVYSDKFYYIHVDGGQSAVWRFDFKSQEASSFLANAELCVTNGFGAEPLFCEYTANAEETNFSTVLYQIKGDETEKIADLPESVRIACAVKGNDVILLNKLDIKNDAKSSELQLFNIKTGESKAAGLSPDAVYCITQDWAHPEQIYVCTCKSSNEILGADKTLDTVYLLKDGELKECVVNGSVAFDSNQVVIIDSYFVDGDFNGHQMAVKENVN